jgi:succinyl-diaminopimelate desuccinylase
MSQAHDRIQTLRSDIDRDSQQIQDFFVRMLRIKSVNPRMGGPGEEERAEFLESFLRAEGFSTTRFDADDKELGKKRPNIMARLEGKGQKSLWFIAHMDTVPEGSMELWNSDPFEPVVNDGKITARGAEDNGQALVSALFALRELKRLDVQLPFNVGIWLVSDEEFGSNYGIKPLIAQGRFRKDDLVIVPDSGTPKGDEIEIAEKGLLWLKLTTKGKQVHASLPSKGLNARRIGMKLAIEIDQFLASKYNAKDPLFTEELSTFEPTKVEPNVANVNTIPGLDVGYFDCRVLPRYRLEDVTSDIEGIIQKHEKSSGASISLELVQKEPAGPATSETSEVAVLLSKAVEETTRVKPRLVGIGGQTVGNLFRRDGIPTAVWSTVDDVPHEPNEYSWIKNLISDAKTFATIPLLAEH